MSLESLLEQEPECSIYRQANPGEVDDAGLPVHDLVFLRKVVGRVMRPSAHQQLVYANTVPMMSMVYTFLTQDTTLENGWFLRDGRDGRLFRFTGTGQVVYPKGNIPTHLQYPMEQWSQTGI